MFELAIRARGPKAVGRLCLSEHVIPYLVWSIYVQHPEEGLMQLTLNNHAENANKKAIEEIKELELKKLTRSTSKVFSNGILPLDRANRRYVSMTTLLEAKCLTSTESTKKSSSRKPPETVDTFLDSNVYLDTTRFEEPSRTNAVLSFRWLWNRYHNHRTSHQWQQVNIGFSV